jgi:hypothetical protein
MLVPLIWRPRVERTLERGRTALDEAASHAALARGRAMTAEQAIEEALSVASEGNGDA